MRVSIPRVATGVFLGLLAFTIFAAAIGGLVVLLGVGALKSSLDDAPAPEPIATQSDTDVTADPNDPNAGDCGEGEHWVGPPEICAPNK